MPFEIFKNKPDEDKNKGSKPDVIFSHKGEEKTFSVSTGHQVIREVKLNGTVDPNDPTILYLRPDPESGIRLTGKIMGAYYLSPEVKSKSRSSGFSAPHKTTISLPYDNSLGNNEEEEEESRGLAIDGPHMLWQPYPPRYATALINGHTYNWKISFLLCRVIYKSK